jgi:hypothetical protein
MTDWITTYRNLYKSLDGYNCSQFIKTIHQVDLILIDYKDYIDKSGKENKSTTKKDYFKDVLLSYTDQIRYHWLEIFHCKIEQTSLDVMKDNGGISNGGKVGIANAFKSNYNFQIISKQLY